jgi:hypothetical protein
MNVLMENNLFIEGHHWTRRKQRERWSAKVFMRRGNVLNIYCQEVNKKVTKEAFFKITSMGFG